MVLRFSLGRSGTLIAAASATIFLIFLFYHSPARLVASLRHPLPPLDSSSTTSPHSLSDALSPGAWDEDGDNKRITTHAIAATTTTTTATTSSTSSSTAATNAVTTPTAISASPNCSVIKVSMLYGSFVFPQLQRSIDTHRRHSERFGCGFETLDRDLLAGERRLFSKQLFMLSILLRELAKAEEDRKQWLMWHDADAMIINPALSPEIFLPPESQHNVYALLTGDHNGFNAGVFYLKVHPNSVDFLTQTIGYPLFRPADDLGWFGEQQAMTNVMESWKSNPNASEQLAGIAWVPRMWFNAYQLDSGFEGKPGHHVVHFAGMGQQRLQHMDSWLSELDQNQAKWEVPLEQTFYKDEIPAFWLEFSANGTTLERVDMQAA